MDSFKKDQLRQIKKDIRTLRKHEAKLKDIWEKMNNNPDRPGGIETTLEAYLDNDLVVKELVNTISRKMEYNRFNLCNIYSAAWNRHFEAEWAKRNSEGAEEEGEKA